jgi:hypothetical protein
VGEIIVKEIIVRNEGLIIVKEPQKKRAQFLKICKISLKQFIQKQCPNVLDLDA